ALAGDVVSLLVPGITGGGVAVRAAARADDVGDALRLVRAVERIDDALDLARTLDRVGSTVDLVRTGDRLRDARMVPGVVTGAEKLADVGRMMRGTHANAGVIPREIGDRLAGRYFADFTQFRQEFWKLLAGSQYASEFSTRNVKRMACGLAPRAHPSQWYGKSKSYLLHHAEPIHAGGLVYDLGNLRIVTPRLHQEVLAKALHYKLVW
ncbi:MAG: hypothetical protein QME94_18200, partial [Anaerolineae bacterium]|nr:hypothetical protein [Anaerolineae bacterium]